MRWKYRGRGRAVWKPRYHVLSLPGVFGYVFNLAALGERAPCKPSALSASPPAATENAVPAGPCGFTAAGSIRSTFPRRRGRSEAGGRWVDGRQTTCSQAEIESGAIAPGRILISYRPPRRPVSRP